MKRALLLVVPVLLTGCSFMFANAADDVSVSVAIQRAGMWVASAIAFHAVWTCLFGGSK